MINLIDYSDKYKDILDEIVNGESKSSYINQISERLIRTSNQNSILDHAFLVELNDDIIGYVYITGMSKNICYIEYLIRKKYRGKKLGTLLLDTVSDKLFNMYPYLKELRLNIDRSNLASMKLASSASYISDDDFIGDKIDFIKDNPYYLSKQK